MPSHSEIKVMVCYQDSNTQYAKLEIGTRVLHATHLATAITKDECIVVLIYSRPFTSVNNFHFQLFTAFRIVYSTIIICFMVVILHS